MQEWITNSVQELGKFVVTIDRVDFTSFTSEEAEQLLKEQNFFSIPVPIFLGFHSPHNNIMVRRVSGSCVCRLCEMSS